MSSLVRLFDWLVKLKLKLDGVNVIFEGNISHTVADAPVAGNVVSLCVLRTWPCGILLSIDGWLLVNGVK